MLTKNKENLLLVGKAKNVYRNDENSIIMEFTNNITAFNNQMSDRLENKGKINCEITMLLFNELKKANIAIHIIEQLNPTDILCKKLSMIPLEVIVRNYAKGSIVKKFGVKEYFKFNNPIVEFSLKNDSLNDPLISERQIIGLNIVNENDLNQIILIALKINLILSKLFIEKNITLLDFKIEFGKDNQGQIILADEISPDSMRLENLDTKIKYDKDIYRNKLGNVIEGYQKFLEVLKND